MKEFEVWHRTPYNPCFEASHITIFRTKEYEKVANVECDSLDDAFRLTNHIDHDWWHNEEIKWYVKGVRSTSVGT